MAHAETAELREPQLLSHRAAVTRPPKGFAGLTESGRVLFWHRCSLGGCEASRAVSVVSTNPGAGYYLCPGVRCRKTFRISQLDKQEAAVAFAQQMGEHQRKLAGANAEAAADAAHLRVQTANSAAVQLATQVPALEGAPRGNGAALAWVQEGVTEGKLCVTEEQCAGKTAHNATEGQHHAEAPSGTATQVSLEPASSGLVAASAPSTPKAKSAAKQHPSPMTVALQHPRRYMSRLSCSLCCDRQPTHSLIPCGHCFCDICPNNFQICPLCRKRFRSTLRVYLAESL